MVRLQPQAVPDGNFCGLPSLPSRNFGFATTFDENAWYRSSSKLSVSVVPPYNFTINFSPASESVVLSWVFKNINYFWEPTVFLISMHYLLLPNSEECWSDVTPTHCVKEENIVSADFAGMGWIQNTGGVTSPTLLEINIILYSYLKCY